MPRFGTRIIKTACADGDPEAIAELSSSIATALRARERLGQAAPVRAHGGIPDSEVASFAYRMLRACQRRAIPPPAELVDLFQMHLKQDRPPLAGESWALTTARHYRAEHPNAGVNEIARHVNVNKGTVSRWKKAGVLP